MSALQMSAFDPKRTLATPFQGAWALDSVLDPNTHVAAFSRSIMNIAAA